MNKSNYGIDALPVVRNLALIGVALLIMAIISFTIAQQTFLANFKFMFLSIGIFLTLEAVLMIVYAKFGKFRHRDRMLNLINWRGDETVLDVGTGRGLLMIGAAKRLTGGKSIGIDIWNAEDLSGNKIENTLQNADLEGVSSKIEIREEDARQMSFPDETFDVVLSNLCLHNIADKGNAKKPVRKLPEF